MIFLYPPDCRLGLFALRALCLFEAACIPQTAVWGYLHFVRFASSRLVVSLRLPSGVICTSCVLPLRGWLCPSDCRLGLFALRALCLFEAGCIPQTAVWGYLHFVRYASSRLLVSPRLPSGVICTSCVLPLRGCLYPPDCRLGLFALRAFRLFEAA
jgi:hypothetical protein